MAPPKTATLAEEIVNALRQEIDITCISFAGSSVRWGASGSSSIAIGNNVSSGMTISGTVKRIVYDGTAAFRIELDQGEGKPSRFIRLFPSGMIAEEGDA
jgi:hypothetical protein